MDKIIIYQILPRLLGDGVLSTVDGKLLEYLKNLGVDMVWYTGIPRHATGKDFVKGDPGSPYAVTDWLDVNPYLARNEGNRMDEFLRLVERTHAAGLEVCMDFIPNHVARDYCGPLPHHDYCDYDWTDTFKVDYDNPDTVSIMCDILRFWAGKGVDAFRCDMVEMVPREKISEIVGTLKKEYPSLLFIAEVYNKDSYRSWLETGFDLLYDKSGYYDILRGLSASNSGARNLSWHWQWLSDMQPKMLNFLENHDEQRIASRYWTGRQDWNPLMAMPALAFSALYNSASFMLYFGQEVGEDAAEGFKGRTSIFEWLRPRKVNDLVSHISSGTPLDGQEDAILSRYRSILSLAKEDVIRKGDVWDLCYCQDSPSFDHDRHFAFMRYAGNDYRIVVCNFSMERMFTTIRIPQEMQALCRRDRIVADVPPMDFYFE